MKTIKFNTTTIGIMIAVGLFVAIISVGVYISGGQEKTEGRLPPQVSGASVGDNFAGRVAQSSDANTPEYQRMVEAQEADRALKAESTGGSSLSNIVGPGKSYSSLEPEKPAATPSTSAAPRNDTQPQQTQSAITPENMKFVELQLNETLAKWKAREPSMLGPGNNAERKKKEEEALRKQLSESATGTEDAVTSNNKTPASGGLNEKDAKTALIRAGTIYPITIDLSGSTDKPGVIRATLQGGPYVDAVLLGKLQKHGEDGISVQFDRLVLPKKTVAVSAIAMNGDASSMDIATRVDRKYLERFVYRPLGAAASALASAIPQKSQTASIMSATGISSTTGGISNSDVMGVAAAKAVEAASTELTGKNITPVAYIDNAERSNTYISVMFLSDVY